MRGIPRPTNMLLPLTYNPYQNQPAKTQKRVVHQGKPPGAFCPSSIVRMRSICDTFLKWHLVFQSSTTNKKPIGYSIRSVETLMLNCSLRNGIVQGYRFVQNKNKNKNTCKYQLSHCLKLLLKLKQLDMGLLMMCSLFTADSSILSCVKSFLSPEIHWLISFNVYFVSCQVVCVCVACSYSQLVPVPILSGIDFLSQAFASHPHAQGKCWHRARTRNGLMCQHDLSG